MEDAEGREGGREEGEREREPKSEAERGRERPVIKIRANMVVDFKGKVRKKGIICQWRKE